MAQDAFAQKSILKQFFPNDLNTIWQKISTFSGKVWTAIESIWQNKIGDKTRKWCAMKWEMVKQEFGKEIEEMKNDINDSLHGKFNNIKFWEKIFK